MEDNERHGKFEVDLVYHDRINYALQVNSVPVITELVLDNQTDDALRGLQITIRPEPMFGDPLERRVDALRAGEEYRFEDLALNLSPEYLSALDERETGLLRVEVHTENDVEPIVSQSYPVELLAARQWGGLRSLPELLAAFVQPNHPELAPLIREASQGLEAKTGSSAFNGYQSGTRQRVLEQARAIFNAVRARNLIYVSPPASFEEEGQRIRSVKEILDQGQGACLDLTALFASALEAAGLHPAIIIVEGHCFVGLWLDKETFTTPVVHDAATVRNHLKLEEFIVFETTLVTDKGATFAAACSHAGSALESEADPFVCAVDLARCRRSRFLPLPSKHGESAKVERETLNDALDDDDLLPPLNLDAPQEAETPEAETPNARLARWQRRLLDLTLRNSLLNFRETKKALPLMCFSLGEMEDALADGSDFAIDAKRLDFDGDGRDATLHKAKTGEAPIRALFRDELKAGRLHVGLSEGEGQKRLLEVFRAAKSKLEETGTNGLYLALGFLSWTQEGSSEPRRAPLLLVPAELDRRSARHGYVLSQGDEDVRFNETLLEMLRVDFGLELKGLSPLPTDDSGIDVPKVFAIVRQAVKGIEGWEVVEDAFVAFFDFAKHLMWRDMVERTDQLMESPLVRHLIECDGTAFDDGKNTDITPDELDERVGCGDVFCPLDSDSSQLAAVVAAAQGSTFVLEGPPGCGKSQTICNIIADHLARDKTVLFVAEKRAALDVVARRLKGVGLGRWVLELHSDKASKAEVVSSLSDPLNAGLVKNPDEWERTIRQLEDLRGNLNAYVTALHRIHRCGLTFFKALSDLSSLRNAPLVRLDWDNPDRHDKEAFAEIATAVADAQHAAANINVTSSNPWYPAGCERWSPKLEREVAQQCRSLADCVDTAEKALQAGEAYLGFEDTAFSRKRLEALGNAAGFLIDAPELPSGLAAVKDWNGTVQKLIAQLEQEATLADLRATFRETFVKDLEDLPAKPQIIAWRQAQTKFVLLKWWESRKVVQGLKAFLQPGKELADAQVLGLLEQLRDLQELESELAPQRAEAQSVLGDWWPNEGNGFAKAKELLEKVDSIRERANAVMPDLWKKWAVVLRDNATALRAENDGGKAIGAFITSESKLRGESAKLVELIGLDEQAAWGDADNAGYLQALRNTALGWAGAIESFRDWCQWRRVRGVVVREVPQLIAAVENGNVEMSDLSRAFRRSYLQWWYETATEAEPLMQEFSSMEQERRIEKFRELAERHQATTRQLIAARLSARVPAASGAHSDSEVGILQRECQKKRRHLSIRTLMSKTQTLLPRLKPCVLMSPSSIAQFLDVSSTKFDLVIFDEASQLPPWDGVGALARGRSAVIVGDPKQLPPTNFFARKADGDEFADDEVEDMESILDEAIASRVPLRTLDWHYRSKAEPLIAFSNSEYYHGRLITQPSCFADADTLGVKWRFLEDAVYQDRSNKVEAAAVVDEIVRRLSDEHLRQYSIGVVTFNQVQQELITNLLEAAIAKRPDLEGFLGKGVEEPVFIKNLENVQGDERDVMIFSTTYGPSPAGKISHNFGALNREGGQRRLNVAVTRARQEMIVFSALKAEMIDLRRTRARGVRDLRLFLEYAEKGERVLAQDLRVSEGESESPLEEEIAAALEAKGYELVKQVGCSGFRIDMAVVDPRMPGRFLLGIEADGATYHRSATARDRDKLRQAVLENLGWRIHRVWSLDWWHQPRKELEKLEAAIAAAQDAEPLPRPDGANHATDENLDSAETFPVEVEHEIVERTDPEDPIYEVYSAGQYGTSEAFYETSSDAALIAAIESAVAVEAPVAEARVMRCVAGMWDISRLGSKVSERLRLLVRRAKVTRSDSDGVRFLWSPTTGPDAYDSFRVPGDDPDSKRKIEEIAVEEIANAAHAVLQRQLGLPFDALVRETAKLFGISRVTPKIQTRIEAAIVVLQERGVVG